MALVVAIIPGVGIIGLLAVILIILGKTPDFASGVVALIPSRGRVRDALRAAAVRYGLNPDWLDAIGWIESEWKPDAVGDQGRSLGPTQIQRRTLANNGYEGDQEALLSDPELAAEWTARLMLPGAKNAEGKSLDRKITSLSELAGWWNAGKPDAPPPDYLAHLESAIKKVSA